MFSDFFFKSSYFCAGVIKIRRRVFVFCGDDFFQRPKTYVTHCTSITTH